MPPWEQICQCLASLKALSQSIHLGPSLSLSYFLLPWLQVSSEHINGTGLCRKHKKPKTKKQTKQKAVEELTSFLKRHQLEVLCCEAWSAELRQDTLAEL